MDRHADILPALPGDFDAVLIVTNAELARAERKSKHTQLE